mgnify:CR=1 FL=1
MNKRRVKSVLVRYEDASTGIVIYIYMYIECVCPRIKSLQKPNQKSNMDRMYKAIVRML